MPALCLAGLVLQGEGIDALGLLDGFLAVCLIGEGVVDGVKGGRGRELVYPSPGH